LQHHITKIYKPTNFVVEQLQLELEQSQVIKNLIAQREQMLEKIKVYMKETQKRYMKQTNKRQQQVEYEKGQNV